MSGVRIVNRILAALVALAVIVFGIIIPVEIIRAAFGRRHWLLPWETLTTNLTRDSWQSGPVRAVLICVAIGLLLLLAQLKPRRPSSLPLTSLTPGVEASTTRSSMRQVLQHAATEVDGVSSATATVSRRKAKVTARADVRDAAGLQEQVHEKVAGRLDSLSLAHPPRLAVTVHAKESR